jgi:hypothetical protein
VHDRLLPFQGARLFSKKVLQLSNLGLDWIAW